MESNTVSLGKYLCGCFHCSQNPLVLWGPLQRCVLFQVEDQPPAETMISLHIANSFSPKSENFKAYQASSQFRLKGKVMRGESSFFLSVLVPSFMCSFHVIRCIFSKMINSGIVHLLQESQYPLPQKYELTLWTHVSNHLRIHLSNKGIR